LGRLSERPKEGAAERTQSKEARTDFDEPTRVRSSIMGHRRERKGWKVPECRADEPPHRKVGSPTRHPDEPPPQRIRQLPPSMRGPEGGDEMARSRPTRESPEGREKRVF
jgi:hypothetical protein